MAAGWLRFLNVPPVYEKIVAASADRDSAELEEAASREGLPLTIARTPQEWVEHPHGALLASKPVIEIEKIAEAEPRPFEAAARPLSDVRVLSFTHAIAGPTVGRTLAEHGADVLNASFPNHYEHDFIYNEANVGSRSATLDLRINSHRQRVEQLLETPTWSSTTTAPASWPSSGSTPSISRSATPESSPSRSAPMGMTARGPSGLGST
jgi:crotonobetainyl-CoA:carnitine CoA-transferase CaiB-like acyl-CoA transferase